MKRISVELVPRDEDALRQELALLGKFQDKVDVINIPDLLRFPIRSWQGAAVAKEYFPLRCRTSAQWISTSTRSSR